MSGFVQGAGNLFHNIGQMFSAPSTPKLQSPNAVSQTPTQADADRAAARQTLDNERMQASTSATLNGGAGLLDQPTTTSRALSGA